MLRLTPFHWRMQPFLQTLTRHLVPRWRHLRPPPDQQKPGMQGFQLGPDFGRFSPRGAPLFPPRNAGPWTAEQPIQRAFLNEACKDQGRNGLTAERAYFSVITTAATTTAAVAAAAIAAILDLVVPVLDGGGASHPSRSAATLPPSSSRALACQAANSESLPR